VAPGADAADMVQELGRFTAAEGPPLWLQILLGLAVFPFLAVIHKRGHAVAAKLFRHASRLELFLIAIAGPVTSIAVAAATLLLWRRTGGPLQDVFYVATVLGVGIGAFTLLPLSLRQNRRPNAKVITFDGYHALSVLLGRSRDVPTCGFPPH
jgi:hypothetical protein